MGWLQCLTDMLSQTVNICTTSLDAYGANTITASQSTPCFAYQDDGLRLVDNGDEATNTNRWQVILPASMMSAVKPGMLVQNIVDQDGNVILVSGRITGVSKYSHWGFGPQCVVLDVRAF